MLKTSLSGTRNSANTAFTIGETPISGGLVLLIHQGLILKRVTGTPTALEYTLVGNDVIVGTPPAAGDMFFGYVQVSATQSYGQTAFTGLQIFSNLSFSLAAAPPSGSSVLLIKNGLVLEEAAGVLTATQYSISGSLITLGAVLVAADSVHAFVSQLASAVLSVVPLTGALNGLNTRYTLGYTTPLNYEPDLLVIVDGVVQTRVISNPLTNQYALVEPRIIRLGIAPNASVKLQVILLGITQVTANPYAFTCERLAQRIGIWVQRNADTVEIEEAVRQVYDEYVQMYQWTFLQIDGMLVTEPVKDDGTVIATTGSRVVSGIGTNFVAADKGKRFRAGQTQASYEIVAVDEINQKLEINPAFIG